MINYSDFELVNGANITKYEFVKETTQEVDEFTVDYNRDRRELFDFLDRLNYYGSLGDCCEVEFVGTYESGISVCCVVRAELFGEGRR